MSKLTVSAAGGAMPAEGLKTRRGALGLMASAVPVLALGAGAALASPADTADGADAALFALLAQWRAADRAADAATACFHDLADSEQLPPPPKGLIVRAEDEDLFLSDEPVGQPYKSPETFAIVSHVINVVRKRHSRTPHHLLAFPRCAEIQAAHDEWREAIKAAREASGYYELDRHAEAARVTEEELRRRVAIEPARSVQGVIAKLAAVAETIGLENLEENTAFADDHYVTFDDVAMTVVRDLARLSRSEAANA